MQNFEKKFNYLMKYDLSIDETVSEASILDFHLAHKTNSDFVFEPKENTDKISPTLRISKIPLQTFHHSN